MTALFPPPSLAAQIAELKREKAMRARVYPFWVQSRKLKQHDADRQQQCLQAAIGTLEAVGPALAALKAVAAAWVNPADGSPFEPGEVPALDDARAAIATLERLQTEGDRG